MIKGWIFNINNVAIDNIGKLSKYLDEIDKEKVSKYKYELNKKHSIMGNFLTKKFLSDHLNIDMENIKFETNEYGKKYIEGNKLFFNISHSGDIVSVVFSDESEIGVDIEKIEDIDVNEVSHFFNDKEIVYLNQFSDELKLDEFYRIWTAKESFLKKIGCGISLSLDKFKIPLGTKDRIEVGDYYIKEVQINQSKVHDNYYISICYDGPKREILIEEYNLCH